MARDRDRGADADAIAAGCIIREVLKTSLRGTLYSCKKRKNNARDVQIGVGRSEREEDCRCQ